MVRVRRIFIFMMRLVSWGVAAKQFVSDMNALGDITHIDLHINSPGGDVFEGIAIFNALKNHGAAITVYVDGVAASMASLIAMAGDTVIMPENAFMMIHKPWGISRMVMRRKCALMPNVWTNLSRLWCRYMRRKPEKPPMKFPPCWRMRPGCPVPVSGTRICSQVTPAVKAMACIHQNVQRNLKKDSRNPSEI